MLIELQAGTAEEHIDQVRLGPRLVALGYLAPDRVEVPRHHAHSTVACRILQRDVGGAVAALRVTGQSPGPARRLDAGDPRHRLGHVPCNEGHVLDAAWGVEALQPILLAAVGIGHHEHRGVRWMGLEQVKEGRNHAHDVDPGLRVAR